MYVLNIITSRLIVDYQIIAYLLFFIFVLISLFVIIDSERFLQNLYCSKKSECEDDFCLDIFNDIDKK